MQRILSGGGLAAGAMAASLAAAEPLPEKGAMVCMIGDDLGLVGWKADASGKAAMLGVMAGEEAVVAGNSLVIDREGATVILKADQVTWVQGGTTEAGPCRVVTNELLGLAEELR